MLDIDAARLNELNQKAATALTSKPVMTGFRPR